MKPDISEFSYGFALTSELVQSHGLQRAGAPVFPSLKSEGSPGGGFDVKLPGLPVFLQFKLSDCLTTKNAHHHAKLGLPYYRFKIRAPKYSKQHDLLLALEAQHNVVFYTAPRFHTPDELNNAFSNSKIVERNAFVAPATIGPLPDVEEHFVSFSPKGLLGIFNSEPRVIEMSDPEVALRQSPRRTRLDLDLSRERSFRDLSDQLIDVYASRVSQDEAAQARRLREVATEREPSDFVRFMALTLFNSELLFAPERF